MTNEAPRVTVQWGPIQKFPPPPPFARTMVKTREMTQTAPPVALTRASFARALRRHTQHSNASSRPRPPCLQRCIKVMYPPPMSLARAMILTSEGQRHGGRGGEGVLKGGAKSGRTGISIPAIPSPRPESAQTASSQTTSKMKCQISRVQSRKTTPPVAPSRALPSPRLRGGRGESASHTFAGGDIGLAPPATGPLGAHCAIGHFQVRMPSLVLRRVPRGEHLRITARLHLPAIALGCRSGPFCITTMGLGGTCTAEQVRRLRQTPQVDGDQEHRQQQHHQPKAHH